MLSGRRLGAVYFKDIAIKTLLLNGRCLLVNVETVPAASGLKLHDRICGSTV